MRGAGVAPLQRRSFVVEHEGLLSAPKALQLEAPTRALGALLATGIDEPTGLGRRSARLTSPSCQCFSMPTSGLRITPSAGPAATIGAARQLYPDKLALRELDLTTSP